MNQPPLERRRPDRRARSLRRCGASLGLLVALTLVALPSCGDGTDPSPESPDASNVADGGAHPPVDDAGIDAAVPDADGPDAAQLSRLPGVGVLRTKGRSIVDEAGKPIALRGVNLGNWLILETWMTTLTGRGADSDGAIRDLLTGRFEATNPGAVEKLLRDYRSRYFTEPDLASFAAMGMNVVRLPFPYWLLESDQAPYVYDPRGFALLDDVLRAAERAGLYVILDLHGAAGGQSTNHSTGRVRDRAELWDVGAHPEYQKRLVALWVAIAGRYATSPVVAGYDLVNEPEAGGTSAKMDDLVGFYDRVVHAIRAVDTKHVLIMERLLEGVFFPGTISDAKRATIRSWTNWVQSEHMYFQFGPSGYDLDPASITDSALGSKVDYYLGQQSSWGVEVPLYVGELGWSRANAFDLLPRQAKVLNDRGVPWTLWSGKTWKPSNMGVVYATRTAGNPLYGSGADGAIDVTSASFGDIQSAFLGVTTTDPAAHFTKNPGLVALFGTYGAK